MSDYQQQLELRIARLEKTLEALATRERIAVVSPWAPLAGGVVYVDSSGSGALKTEPAFSYDEALDELIVGRARLTEQATPSTPPNPFAILFANTVGLMSAIDDTGAIARMVPAATLTYTPTYLGGTVPGVTTYSIQIGRYRQLADNLVWFFARVDWTNATGTGVAQVSLPFTSRNTANAAQSISVWTSNVTFAAQGIICVVNPNSAIAFVGSPTTNAATATIAMETAGTIIIEGVYETA